MGVFVHWAIYGTISTSTIVDWWNTMSENMATPGYQCTSAKAPSQKPHTLHPCIFTNVSIPYFNWNVVKLFVEISLFKYRGE